LCEICRQIREVAEWKAKAKQTNREAKENILNWVEGRAEKDKFTSHVLHEGRLYMPPDAIKRFLKEANTAEKKWIITVLEERSGTLHLEDTKLLGATKDLTNMRDKKNVNKKKDRGVVKYNYYRLDYMGKSWWLSMEVLTGGKLEQPYCIQPYRKK
jgi:hypothetical protein